MSDQQPLVSIDVVPFRYSPEQGLLFAVGERLFEPYLGRLALPGVLLHAGESIDEAAERALSTKVDLPVGKQLHVGAFDSTNRDPRGATISITLLSIQDQQVNSAKARWIPVQEPIELPFDHNFIVEKAFDRLSQAIWNDVPLTRSLFGESFTTSDALVVKSPSPHTSNVARWLKSWGPLQKGEAVKTKSGAGRPSTTWSWIDES